MIIDVGTNSGRDVSGTDQFENFLILMSHLELNHRIATIDLMMLCNSCAIAPSS